MLVHGTEKTFTWQDYDLVKGGEQWSKTSSLPMELLATVEQQQERFMRALSQVPENCGGVCLDVRREMTHATSWGDAGFVSYTGPRTVNGAAAIRPKIPGLFAADTFPPLTVTIPTTNQLWELQSVLYPPAIYNGRKKTLPAVNDSAKEAFTELDIDTGIEAECERLGSTVVTVPIVACRTGHSDMRLGGWANYRWVPPEETVSTEAVLSSV